MLQLYYTITILKVGELGFMEKPSIEFIKAQLLVSPINEEI